MKNSISRWLTICCAVILAWTLIFSALCKNNASSLEVELAKIEGFVRQCLLPYCLKACQSAWQARGEAS